jgi:NAD(P)-dependent dehydrogenase (short-subunit alcohol dehydrogenase family)
MDRKTLYLAVAGIGAGLIVRGVLRKPAGLDLYSKVVLITGSAGGLGLALAREFAAEGCRLALAGNDPAGLDQTRHDLQARGAPVFITRCDVTNLAQVDGATEAVIDHYGRIDILVNNAGRIDPAALREMSLEDFERAMDLMFWGIVYPTRAVLPQMLERRAGRIVNIVSGDGHAAPHLLPRDCAKFAAIGFSEGLRAELLPEAISVITIVPPVAPQSDARTARHIVTAARRGNANGLGVTGRSDIGRLIHDLLAGPHSVPSTPVISALTAIGRLAARRYLGG